MSFPRTSIALTALASAAALAPAAHAANGPIVFERAGVVNALAPGAAAPTPIAGETTYDPAVSPDGRHVAYVFQRDVWVMDADGSGARRVTTDAADHSGPAWSPDGKRIVMTTRTADSVDLATVPAAGGAATALTSTPDNDERNPAWSPDGQQIAFERSGCDTPNGGGTCVYVMPAAGGAATNLTAEDAVPGCESQPGYFFNGSSKEPAWSPDSQTIAFTGPLDCQVSSIGSDIWTMSRTGAGKVDLTHDDGTIDAGATFAPDGTAIAFQRGGVNVAGGLFAMPATGGAATRLTTGDRDIHADWGLRAAVCTVPALKGRTVAGARKRLTAAHCRLGKRTFKKGRTGRVLSQSIAKGKVRPAGTKVAVTVGR